MPPAEEAGNSATVTTPTKSDARLAFEASLNFPLDDFQLEAIEALDTDHSVVVCAPTGSGKTIIAEFAATKTLHEGGKIFYTSPLKALSNQKFLELKERFGEGMVGLLTGDTSVNREARIVVMTTEVFRNMLYGLNDDSGLLDNLKYVVLDECHFMNDADRGTVWEESIIYCPPHVKMVALSATVKNAEELTSWIDHIHKPAKLIYSDFRPVPLRLFYYGRHRLFPLFEKGTKRLNQKIVQHGTLHKNAGAKGKGRPGGGPIAGRALTGMIESLAERDMLPAIVFTFSRKGCERSLRECGENLRLMSKEQRDAIADRIAYFKEHTTLNLEPYQEEALLNGIASHHAGLLPGVKLLVESLFQQGLLKVVFATETLAAGINMPARTTVISSISKRTDVGHRILTASEFLQMAGRAGRRGMDDVGHVVLVASAYEKPQEMAKLASSPANSLNSQFTPTYGMVLNLLQKFSLDEAGYLVNKSFGAFTSDRRTQPITDELADRQSLLDEAKNFPCPVNLTLEQFLDHLADRETISKLNKQKGRVERQAKKMGEDSDVSDQINALDKQLKPLIEKVSDYPCSDCPELKKHRRLVERMGRLERQIDRLEEEVEAERNVYWTRFLNLAHLLSEAGYLDEDNKPTSMGIMASKIRAENELYIAELVGHGIFNDLEYHEIAAVFSALVNDSNRENVMSTMRYSKPVKKALDKIFKERERVAKLQKQFHIDVDMHLNAALSPLVEAWAMGASWDGLLASSSADAGDLVRNTRRTMDLLRQVSVIREVPPDVAHACYQAAVALNREPVKEIDFTEASEAAAGEQGPPPGSS